MLLSGKSTQLLKKSSKIVILTDSKLPLRSHIINMPK
jgi:hypothetical protein